MDKRTALDGDIVMEKRPGYMRVWHGRSAQTLEEAQAVLDALDEAMSLWGVDRMLFDSRDADGTPPKVGQRIWAWLEANEHLRRVATLVESEDRAERINTGGVGIDVRIRAFHNDAPAIRWLTTLR
ncbi:MAG: hypothetical protein KC912_19910 [Proteobacteria bacterium]|nr:hypothetical protein [Pseudomonadota bacterium]